MLHRTPLLILLALLTGILLFSAGCATKKKPEDEVEYKVPQSKKNRDAWQRDMDRMSTKERRSARRPTRGDVFHFHNSELQVLPGRKELRSKELYERDSSVFSLW